jgi:ABC-2 type transport system ATP-binding protein
MALALRTKGLTKTYKGLGRSRPVVAVDHLDIEVEEGLIFGFLGPNGAGKTTTIKMLLGLIFPTEGEGWLLDKPIGDISAKQQISYLPESPYFYEHLSAGELLDFYARLFGIPAGERAKRIDRLLTLVGLPNDNKPLREFSKGMLQRAGIAQALINDPKLLIFDEPTSGLDPIAHTDIRDLILQLREQGKTVFLSSHQLSDVEMVCDRVAILNRGKLVRVGDVEALRAGTEIELVVEAPDEATEAQLRRIAQRVVRQETRVLVYHHDEAAIGEMVDVVRQHKVRLISVTPQRRSLESIFLETVREGQA